MRKELKESEVKGRLAVPMAWWRLINPGGLISSRNGVPVCVVDGATGMFWEFEGTVRQKGRYLKPVLQSSGWLRYVNWKGLVAGDMVVLEPGHDEFRGTRLVLTAWRLGVDGQTYTAF